MLIGYFKGMGGRKKGGGRKLCGGGRGKCVSRCRNNQILVDLYPLQDSSRLVLPRI